MADSVDNINAVPERIVVSGDGLRDMELSHFRTLVRTLGSMGLTVEGIDYADPEVAHNPEVETEDTPLYKSDFMRVANNNDFDKDMELFNTQVGLLR